MHDIDHAVVQQLYEAAAGGVDWNVALGAVHDALRVSATQFFVIEKANLKLEMAENSDGSPPEAMFDYVRFGYRIDPHVAHAAALPVGELLQTAKVFPREQYKNHPYYLEMWGPHNVREVLGAKVAENERHVAMFGVTRQWDLPPFTDGEVNLMRRYTGHVAAALKIAKHLERMQTNAIAGYGLMQASGRPMFLLDRSSGLLSANDLAREMLERGDTFAILNGVFRCLRPEGRRVLEHAMTEIAIDRADADANALHNRLGIRLPRVDGTPLLCSLWDLRPEATMGAFGSLPAVLLTVVHPPQGNAVDPIWLGSLFDLSPAEVRVASGLMRGEALRDIADFLHVSVETVRSQVKSICAKTGTHRQSSLVSTLLRASAL